MPTKLQLRRGTTTEHNSFTGAAGEVTFDTTLDTIRVHDGSTAGGIRLAKHSEVTLEDVVGGAGLTESGSTTVTLAVGAGTGITVNADDIAVDTATIFASAALTGTPTAPTASTGTSTTQIATTAFVQQEITALKALLYAYDQS